MLWGAATVAFVYPGIRIRLRRTLKRRWSRQLLEMLGLRLKVSAGGTAVEPGLLVCNHVSWLDIFVINALVPSAFVSKSDVKQWPLIGWLCAHTETIFLERDSHAAAQRTRETMRGKLISGDHVAVFPEGTTTGGDRVLPFHAALFQSAIDAGSPVVPLALRYVDSEGRRSAAQVYAEDISVWQSLRALAGAEALTAQLHVLPALTVGHNGRRLLASQCHAAISRSLATGTAGASQPNREMGNWAENLLPCPSVD